MKEWRRIGWAILFLLIFSTRSVMAEAMIKVKEVVKAKDTTKSSVPSKAEIRLLAKVIASEALGESYEVKCAVGNVIMFRAEHKSKNIKKVVYSRSQFSGVNGVQFRKEPSEACLKAATEVLNGKVVVVASHFLNLDLCKQNNNVPEWTKQFKFVKRIDNTWFYYNEDWDK